MKPPFLAVGVLVALCASLAISSRADVRLPSLFSDHMVVQRETPVPVWGWDAAGRTVTVKCAGQTVSTVADDNGCWRVDLEPMEAGGPHRLVVSGSTKVAVRDVLVGEVWLCSGQSNMQWPVRRSANAEYEIDAAYYPAIRLLSVKNQPASEPQTDIVGEWQVCTSNTVGNFSAVGYFFGRELHRRLGCPVGLINNAWGGTPAEAWTSYETLTSTEELTPIVTRYEAKLPKVADAQAVYEREKAAYDAYIDGLLDVPTGETSGWATCGCTGCEWHTVSVPGLWEETLGTNLDGIVWFRRDVVVPVEMAHSNLMLELGPIDDFDRTYLNGALVGSIGRDTKSFWIHPRRYAVPASLVKPGTNQIAVRVVDHGGGGGFAGNAADLRLYVEGQPGKALPLSGEWRACIEHGLTRQQPDAPIDPNHPHSPAGLFHGRVCPLMPYALRGVIWYQGESNAGRAEQYRTLFPAMIRDWRAWWKRGDFPFLFVQLANFMARPHTPVDSPWAELREAQTMTLELDNTAMAVAIDLGESDDIHPRNKQDIGARLALAARALAYGEDDLVHSGPLYESMDVEDGKIRIRFTHLGGGLTARGGALEGFAIAGADTQFRWAKAKIDGDTVLVWHDEIETPVAVRYGWGDNPLCTLYNMQGLPASPFRTDDWPGVTTGKR